MSFWELSKKKCKNPARGRIFRDDPRRTVVWGASHEWVSDDEQLANDAGAWMCARCRCADTQQLALGADTQESACGTDMPDLLHALGALEVAGRADMLEGRDDGPPAHVVCEWTGIDDDRSSS